MECMINPWTVADLQNYANSHPELACLSEAIGEMSDQQMFDLQTILTSSHRLSSGMADPFVVTRYVMYVTCIPLAQQSGLTDRVTATLTQVIEAQVA